MEVVFIYYFPKTRILPYFPVLFHNAGNYGKYGKTIALEK